MQTFSPRFDLKFRPGIFVEPVLMGPLSAVAGDKALTTAILPRPRSWKRIPGWIGFASIAASGLLPLSQPNRSGGPVSGQGPVMVQDVAQRVHENEMAEVDSQGATADI